MTIYVIKKAPHFGLAPHHITNWHFLSARFDCTKKELLTKKSLMDIPSFAMRDSYTAMSPPYLSEITNEWLCSAWYEIETLRNPRAKRKYISARHATPRHVLHLFSASASQLRPPYIFSLTQFQPHSNFAAIISSSLLKKRERKNDQLLPGEAAPYVQHHHKTNEWETHDEHHDWLEANTWRVVGEHSSR